MLEKDSDYKSHGLTHVVSISFSFDMPTFFQHNYYFDYSEKYYKRVIDR